MAFGSSRDLVAVDIGNQRIKYGFFSENTFRDLPDSEDLPLPEIVVSQATDNLESLSRWLAELPSHKKEGPLRWVISSVRRDTFKQLENEIAEQRPRDTVQRLSTDDLPLVISVGRPDRVGIDRLVAACAAKRLKEVRGGTPTVIVDSGTAITIDLIGTEGDFRGGAILPGLEISLRSLHEKTDALPLLRPATEAPLPLPGRDTREAMQAGVLRGAVGAVREIAWALFGSVKAETGIGGSRPVLIITGGAGDFFHNSLRESLREREGEAEIVLRHVPELVLSGIACLGGGWR